MKDSPTPVLVTTNEPIGIYNTLPQNLWGNAVCPFCDHRITLKITTDIEQMIWIDNLPDERVNGPRVYTGKVVTTVNRVEWCRHLTVIQMAPASLDNSKILVAFFWNDEPDGVPF